VDNNVVILKRTKYLFAELTNNFIVSLSLIIGARSIANGIYGMCW